MAQPPSGNGAADTLSASLANAQAAIDAHGGLGGDAVGGAEAAEQTRRAKSKQEQIEARRRDGPKLTERELLGAADAAAGDEAEDADEGDEPEVEGDEGDEGEDADAGEQDADDAEGDEDADAAADADGGPRLGLRALSEAQYIALRRAQVPNEVISELSDAALIALAEREAANEARNKAQYESLSKKQLGTEGNRDDTPEAGSTQKRASTAEPGVEAPRGLPEPVLEELGLSESNSKALNAWAADIIKQANAVVARARDEALGAARQEAAKASAMVEAQTVRAIRADLAESYPQVTSQPKWAKLYEKAKLLAPGYVGYDDTEDAMRQCLTDAAYMVFGEPQAKATAKGEKKPTTTPAPKAKQMSRPGRTAARSTRKLSPKEQSLRNAAEALRAHNLTEQGRRPRW